MVNYVLSSPTIPTSIIPAKKSLVTVTGSPKQQIPITGVLTAPIPV